MPLLSWMGLAFSRLALVVLWILHLLPLPALRATGVALGLAGWLLAGLRRRVGMINLRLCFPEQSEAWRRQLCRRHFVLFTQALLEKGIMRWAAPSRLKRLIRVRGAQQVDWHANKPIILLGIHNVGLELGSVGLCAQTNRAMAVIHSDQKNRVFGDFLIAARQRFGVSISRNKGLRGIVRLIKDGTPLFYFPDQDFGPRDSMFVPFFGNPAATTHALPRLATLTGAQVVPHFTLLTKRGYEVEIFAPWNNFPSGDMAADTKRMGEFIEAAVRRAPEQYFWLHRRFKTRPPGEPSVY